MKKLQNSEFILLILDGVWVLFLIQIFLKNLGFQNPQIEMEMFFYSPPSLPIRKFFPNFLHNYPKGRVKKN